MDSIIIIGGYKPIEVGNTASNSTSASSATYSFNLMSVGDPSTDRLVIVCLSTPTDSSTPVTLSSATIGGITATKVVEHTNTSSGYSSTSTIISAVVPTGSFATVEPTYSSVSNGCVALVYFVKGLNSYTVDATSTGSSTLTIPNGGVCFTCSGANFSSGNSSGTISDSPFNYYSSGGNRQSLILAGKIGVSKDHNTIAATSGFLTTASYVSESGAKSICRAAWGN